MYKKAFSFRGFCPLTPPGAVPRPRHPFRLALLSLTMVPPLENPGSATATNGTKMSW